MRTPSEKLEKRTVHYGPGMPNAECRICVHWEPPESCEIVKGRIEPHDWCTRFKKDHKRARPKR